MSAATQLFSVASLTAAQLIWAAAGAAIVLLAAAAYATRKV
jgi:hypothetical protein